jgi:hypothetical protein
MEEVIDMCKIIYAMDPKPGRAYAANDTNYVTPDVYVYKVGDDYSVSLNEDGLPKLKISNFYRNMLKGGTTPTGDNKAADYISEKLKQLYIALDGIPTMSKIIEQKKRRYSGYIIDEISKKIFDKNYDKVIKDDRKDNIAINYVKKVLKIEKVFVDLHNNTIIKIAYDNV